jgi:guanylate kinase
MVEHYPGDLIIVAAPSGGGKTSLVKKLVNTLDKIEVSISHTTRAMRPGEKEAVDYFFVEQQQFEEMIETKSFIEYAKVFNHYYGTSVAQINARLQAGIDVVLDIDWQGAQQIRKIFPRSISIFVLPPSIEILQQRLAARRQDEQEVIDDRMKRAQDELSHFAEFDYLIVNEDFDKAAQELQAIVIANRLGAERQKSAQRKLLSFLLSSQ